MGKLIGSFLVFFFLQIAAVPQELAAQSFFGRLFTNGDMRAYNKTQKRSKHKRLRCGYMAAYNKGKAYKKHKKTRSRRAVAKRTTTPADKEKVVSTSSPKKTTAPPPATKTSITRTTQPGKSSETSPKKDVPAPVTPPAPGTETAPTPLAKVTPTAPGTSSPPAEKAPPALSRASLKKMTEQERRDTLQQLQPEIVLPPIQFISDQDEFSVVNMDSFMQAMEYAQQGKVVLVEGHTDDLGREEYNLQLSMKRAEKIRQLLLSGDVSDELISVIGYGESQPKVPNTSTENRAINRRIEFKIFSLPE